MPSVLRGALLLSLAAHVAAAAAAVVIWRTSSEGSAAPRPEAVDVELGPAGGLPEDAPAPPARDQLRAPRRPAITRRAAAAAPTLGGTPAPTPPATAAVDPAPGVPLRFVLSAGTVATRPSSAAPSVPASGDSRSGGGTGGAATGIVEERVVAVRATLLSGDPVVYPPAARAAEIEVDLPLEIVVGSDGRVRSARPLAHPGHGLEQAAARAVRSYRFSPALRDGHPVSVRMIWTLQFRLRS